MKPPCSQNWERGPEAVVKKPVKCDPELGCIIVRPISKEVS